MAIFGLAIMLALAQEVSPFMVHHRYPQWAYRGSSLRFVEPESQLTPTVLNLGSEAELMSLAETSALPRGSRSQGVAMAVLYVSMLDLTQAGVLDAWTNLANDYPECNLCKVGKEFADGERFLAARLVGTTPSFEVIFQGKRVSLTEGVDAASIVPAICEAFAALGFKPTPPSVRDCVFSTSQPLGWRRSVTDMVVTVVKPGGQAEELAVCVGDKILKVDGTNVVDDADFEAAVQSAKSRGQGVMTVTLQSAASLEPSDGSIAAQASAAYARAQDDRSSGAFRVSPPEGRSGRNEKVERFTTDFLPGNKQLNDAAERLTKGIEDLFTNKGEDEDDSKKKKKNGREKGPR